MNNWWSKEEILYRVTLPYAVFGVVVKTGMVIYAAPIARWAVGRTYQSFAQWVLRKGGALCKANKEV